MVAVVDHIEDARKKLLDLTLRNRLLNYRPTKARTLRILSDNSPDLYESLVLNEKQMMFRATKPHNPEPPLTPASSPENKNQTDNDVPEKEAPVWKPSTRDSGLKPQQPERYLDTAFDPETLKKRLYYIAHESKSVLEEQGYTILYLALGSLEWYESPASDKPSRAPLILIPVELKRQEVRDSFKLQWTNEDIMTNLSLKEKLRELGVILPDFEMPEDKTGIDSYFLQVKDAIARQQRWNIFTDIYLDFFSFTKFVMYKDLDSAAWPAGMTPATHPLINAIFNPDPNIPKIPGFNDEEVDQKIRADAVYHVLDADSSQIAAIEDIKAGKNLVVQGPPGTGKSQTIANAIADLLAGGKTVLFISEKMAALEVVKKRLDNLGLGDFCLELHSRKSNIKEVHRKLQRTLQMQKPVEVDISASSSQIEMLKSDLNAYPQSLFTPVGSTHLTPYFLFGQLENARKHFTDRSREMVRFPLVEPDKVTEPEWQSGLLALKNLIEVLPRVRPVQRQPWYGCNPKNIHPSDEVTIRQMIVETKEAFFTLQKKMETLAGLTGLSYPDNLYELKNAIGATKLFVSPNPIDRNLLLNDAWNQPNPQVALVIEKINTFQQMREQITKKFDSGILKEDLESFLKEFQPLTTRFVLLKFVNSRYRVLKQQALLFYSDRAAHSDTEIVQDLSYILRCINERTQIRACGQLGRSLFGTLWQDENSDLSRLKEFSAWIVQFRHEMLEEVFTERTVEMMSHGIALVTIEKAAEEVSLALQDFLQHKFKLFSRLAFSAEKRFLQKEEFVEFQKFQALLFIWEQNLPLLQDWSYYANFSSDCKATVAGSFIDTLEEHDLPPEDAVITFEGNYAEALLRKAFSDRPELERFLGDTHEQKIRSFIALDRRIIESNRWRLIWQLSRSMPNIENEASPNSELGTLKLEFERKKNRMPIRKLIKNTGGLIQKITPCFMMGPLSVAQFLDPRTVKFDVIIFDEASQVRPEDALGALLRGNQAVVIGDYRQLPPTSFFDKLIEDEVEEPEAVPAMSAGMESILNLCKVSFPTKTLRWHYRSRHESLIALSNAEFYDNKLFVYPSPMMRSDAIGLKFVHLPDTCYDRGKSQVNRAEAKAVAQAVFEHFVRKPEKSLGVGTFNIKQQQAILDEIEAMRYQRPEMEPFFRDDLPENFFVKNLETIQGDERDVIFLSVGYGRDSSGRLTQNFGPLNQEGGERRLNVLITRAREQCVVFSNFTARDLPVTDASAVGVRILKLFLDYAESGNLSSTSISTGDAESPFEDAVYEFLVSGTFLVRKQIGCAGFRIDMAVVDPRQPGRYLLGIECDGAQYHSSKVARDRDRLRQQVLEGLGWKIYRVWSTDWYRNSAESKKRLMEAIEKEKSLPVQINPEIKTPEKPVIADKPPEVIPGREYEPAGRPNKGNESAIPDYIFCTSVKPDAGLMEAPLKRVEQVIIEIVAVEGPIHIEELFQRVRTIGNFPRITPKIKDQILFACNDAAANGGIQVRDSFLWQPVAPQSLLRRRSPEQGIDIEWICDEEIGEAIRYILHSQYATVQDDLIVPTLKIFGLQRRTDKATKKVNAVIESKIKTGELERLPNGKIYFKEMRAPGNS